MSKIILIVGPTATGKTALSIALAKEYNAEIINADSTQIYKEPLIATAKITEEEKEGILHHMIDIKSLSEEYSIYDYQKDARKAINIIESNSKLPIFVGGSGLYIRSALYDYKLSEENKRNDYSKYTNEELYDMAKKYDPNFDVHINNRKRIERFLNIKDNNEDIVADSKPLYDFILIGLTMDREKLYERINKRVDIMFEQGLLEEVKALYNKNKEASILHNAIGYKEIISYLDGNITLEEAKELIKRNSRRFAKRQYTFFNNQFEIKWFEVQDDLNKTIEEIKTYIFSVNK
jgi:tRNA dimethylallyltransferase